MLLRIDDLSPLNMDRWMVGLSNGCELGRGWGPCVGGYRGGGGMVFGL